MQSKHLTAGGFEVARFAVDVRRQLDQEDFPGVEAEKLSFVFDNPRATRPRRDAAITKARRRPRRASTAVQVVPAVRAGGAGLRQARSYLMALKVDGRPPTRRPTPRLEIRKNADILEGDDAVSPIHLVGLQALWAGMQELSKEDLEKAEGIGFPIVFIVLLLVFGSLAAAALPLSLGFIAVAITGAIVYFLSQAIEMSIFVTNIASMLGIGVAVDYSLFILARYREEIEAGLRPRTRRAAVAMRTSGMAVAFSGVTVIIALAGLFLIDAKTRALDGDRRDRRRRRRRARRRDAAAGADRRARPPGRTSPGKVIGKSRQAQPQAQGRPGPFWDALDEPPDEPPAAYAIGRHRADAPDRLARARR